MNLFQAIITEQSAASVAVVYENLPITYADLQDQTLGVAVVLNLLEVGKGERVALLLNDSTEFIASFISICSSGAIAVPINMGLRLEEQRAILNDCTARVAIVEADLCSSLLTDAQERLSELKDVVVVSRDREKAFAPETQSVQNGRDEGHRDAPRIRALNHLLDEGHGLPPRSFTQPEEHEAAVILYTSGSTGEPKGAVHRQADIFYTNETFCREVLGLRSGDRIFSSSRLPFAYGLGNSLSFPLLNGVTSILCREKPTPDVISRMFSQCKPTIFFGVPVVYNLLLEYHRREGNLDCSSLRLCVSAGEALPAQLGEDWEKTFGVEVLDGIGSTEMMHMFMSNHEGDVRYGSSGKLLNGYEARLLNQEGSPTPEGEVGNLWVKGRSAAMGYWQKPQVTANTFVDGWVRTGDLYARDGDGFWFHMGRSDDCFKSSGQWVSPVEVEGALLRHEGVSRVAVVEDFDKDGLPCACAFVICSEEAPDFDGIESKLRESLKNSLPRFKQPRRYIFVDELPYTATGKIQRFKLREQLRDVA
ncbi:MAG: benzoate-CoA ligase family protein [Pyrinomonadaceae bacterium]|nr:benzoate-CoA ligase family protein [Pyrinomonadaceae bacterium]